MTANNLVSIGFTQFEKSKTYRIDIPNLWLKKTANTIKKRLRSKKQIYYIRGILTI